MTCSVVQIHQVDSIPLAVVRRRVSPSELSRVVPECCGIVWEAVRAQHAKAGRHVALYLDNSIQLEVGVEIFGPFVEQGEVVRSATPAGAVALITHFGPYHQLSTAHNAIHAWCKKSGHQFAGPSWEIYRHWQPEWNTDPSKIRTDIYYRIA